MLGLPVVEAVAQAVGHGPLGEQGGPAPADVLGGSPPALRRSGTCPAGRRRRPSASPPPSRWIGRRRQLARRAGRPTRVIAAARSSGMAIASRARRISALSVRIASRSSGLQARQPIEPLVDRRRVRHDPPEGVRRHAEAGRHADAFDPRKLPQVRALAANERDLRLVDLLETQHVALDHCDTSRVAVLGCTAVAS